MIKNQDGTTAANATGNRTEGKSLVAIIVIIVLIVAGIAWVFANPANDAVNYPNASPANTDVSGSSGAGVVATSSAQSYTLADIAPHKDAKSCWVAVDGSVYDLTSFVGQHEGGDIAILSLCGRDGSADFHEQHGMGGREQQAVFAKYRIGALTK